MTTKGIAIVVVVGALFLTGCAHVEVGSRRSLGEVSYPQAFNAARAVMGQYYTVAEADPTSGLLRSEPKWMAGRSVLGENQRRELATVRVRRADGEVVAYAAVTVQRQASRAAQRMAWPEGVYDGPPHQTPAQLEGATTVEQNESWITERRDRGLEEQILTDIYDALHGQTGG